MDELEKLENELIDQLEKSLLKFEKEIKQEFKQVENDVDFLVNKFKAQGIKNLKTPPISKLKIIRRTECDNTAGCINALKNQYRLENHYIIINRQGERIRAYALQGKERVIQ